VVWALVLKHGVELFPMTQISVPQWLTVPVNAMKLKHFIGDILSNSVDLDHGLF